MAVSSSIPRCPWVLTAKKRWPKLVLAGRYYPPLGLFAQFEYDVDIVANRPVDFL
jgi:hypothetical protein